MRVAERRSKKSYLHYHNIDQWKEVHCIAFPSLKEEYPYMHKKDIRISGKNIADTTNALILLHGRGASAEDILGLADHLQVGEFALVAPQATNRTWYPYSFLALPQQNEPWLSSAIELLSKVVDDLVSAGLQSKNIYFSGFSQGACLALEFVTRNAQRWGGVAAFTGGLIGDRIYPTNYRGDFEGTPVFIGSGDPDPHVPADRVRDTSRIMGDMGANVLERIYPMLGHTISADEIHEANQWVFQSNKTAN